MNQEAPGRASGNRVGMFHPFRKLLIFPPVLSLLAFHYRLLPRRVLSHQRHFLQTVLKPLPLNRV